MKDTVKMCSGSNSNNTGVKYPVHLNKSLARGKKVKLWVQLQPKQITAEDLLFEND